MTATAQAVLNVARSQIGVVEAPINLQKYGAWYGWNGVSWCDQFVSWCAAQAGAGDIIPRSAYVPGRLSRAVASHLTVSTPQPGDLACFDWNRDGLADHIGFVEKVLDTGHVQTIEGNTTSPSGRADQSNGDGVYRRSRALGTVRAFIRPRYATPIIVRPAPYVSSGTRPLVVDGSWGPMTTKHLQLFLHLTPIDGAFGARTISALQRWLNVRATGTADLHTRVALQHRLGVNADGVIGPVTVRALQRYLNRVVA